MKHVTLLTAIVSIAGRVFLTPVPTAQTDLPIFKATFEDQSRSASGMVHGGIPVVRDEGKLMNLLERGRADAVAALERSCFKDPSTLRSYYRFLRVAYAVVGDLERSCSCSKRARELGERKGE
jgi:hypothetical protein